jgi:glutamine synthetase
MYAEGHTVKDAPKLPLNMLDAIRAYDADAELKAKLGAAFSASYVKMKHQEWNAFASHFSSWEKDNTLDI